MNIGLDVTTPQNTCDDENCPFHGSLRVRGQMIEGRVVGDRMQDTVTVEREYLRYLSKFERYEKRKAKYLAHNPSCIGARVGDGVKLMECRPLSKAKSFVVVEKFTYAEGEREPVKPEEKREEKPKEKVKAKGKTKEKESGTPAKSAAQAGAKAKGEGEK